jgi:cardiolipin synthase A/B
VSSANLTQHAFNLNIELGVMVVDGESASKAVEQIETLIREGVLRQLRT